MIRTADPLSMPSCGLFPGPRRTTRDQAAGGRWCTGPGLGRDQNGLELGPQDGGGITGPGPPPVGPQMDQGPCGRRRLAAAGMPAGERL
jgi:hypothetical protein